jgi:dihydrodipicolinate synthase/N-acetylneuraminate lyase
MKAKPFVLDGIVPIVNTPFTADHAIDYSSLERLLRRSIADGIVGCVVPAVASEVGKLTPAERENLLKAVLSIVGSEITVVAGVSSDDIDESCRLAQQALSAGCEAVLCRAPEAIIDQPDALVRYFTQLARQGMPTLMIQDLQWNGAGMTIDTIVRLHEQIPAFTAIKVETVPPGAKYTAIFEATAGGLHVSCGWGLGQMIEALDRGVSTFTTTAINLPFVEVHRRYRAGDREGARHLFHETAPMLVWCQQHIDTSIAFLKRYCVAAGLFTTDSVRPPAAVFDEVHSRIADELIQEILTLEARLRAEAHARV